MKAVDVQLFVLPGGPSLQSWPSCIPLTPVRSTTTCFPSWRRTATIGRRGRVRGVCGF